MIKKNIIKIFVFIIGLVVMINVCNEVLRYKDCDSKVKSFYNLDLSKYEVLFLGTSHMECGVSPVEIYNNTGISSYNFGTSLQSIETSYYVLKEYLNYGKPKVVVLDVSSLFFVQPIVGSGREFWSVVLDKLRLSKNKIQFAETYATDEAGFHNDYFWAALFPLYRYHTRWNEISKNDFVVSKDDITMTMGYLDSNVVGIPRRNPQQVNDIENCKNQEATIYRGTSGEDVVAETQLSIINESDIWAGNIDWLCKIKSVCDENGIELMLVKVPSWGALEDNGSSWTHNKSDKIEELSATLGLDFVDFVYSYDTGIDWKVDSRDKGSHLNVLGASKISKSLGDVLLDKYKNLNTSENKQMECVIDDYYAKMNIKYINAESNYKDYLNRILALRENYVGYIILSGQILSEVNNDLNNCIESYDDSSIYILKIENGAVVFAEQSNSFIKIDNEMGDIHGEIVAVNDGLCVKLIINKKTYSEYKTAMIGILTDQKGYIYDVSSFVFENNDIERNYSYYTN